MSQQTFLSQGSFAAVLVTVEQKATVLLLSVSKQNHVSRSVEADFSLTGQFWGCSHYCSRESHCFGAFRVSNSKQNWASRAASLLFFSLFNSKHFCCVTLWCWKQQHYDAGWLHHHSSYCLSKPKAFVALHLSDRMKFHYYTGHLGRCFYQSVTWNPLVSHWSVKLKLHHFHSVMAAVPVVLSLAALLECSTLKCENEASLFCRAAWQLLSSVLY